MRSIKEILSEFIPEDNFTRESPKTPAGLEENKNLQKLDYPASNADIMAEKCNFIREFKATGLTGNEPAWYMALGIVRHCVDGEEKCHEYSAKDSEYKESLTNQKLQYLRQKDISSIRCSTLEQHGFCKDCPYKGKVTSPIQLGAFVSPAEDMSQNSSVIGTVSRAKELMELVPKEEDGWLVGKQGIFKIVDGVPTFVSNKPFFIVDKICEDFGDSTLITVIIRYPARGTYFDFKLPLKSIAEPKKLEAEFSGRGIFSTEKKYLKWYLVDYVNNIEHIEPYQIVNSLGWQPNGSFVYNFSGDTYSHKAESIKSIIDIKASSYLRGLESRGTLEEWLQILKTFMSSEDLYPHVFSVLCSIGAPLLKFTAAKGVILSLQGETGCGKTLAHRAALSVWGDPETAGNIGTKDTHIAMLGRLGAMKNLPVRMDEVTTIETKKLSGLVYEFVNGRGRSRATIDGSLSSTSSEWQTISLFTTNKPLLENSVLTLSEAERCRVLELEAKMPKHMEVIGKNINSIITKNYGVLGKILADLFVKNKDRSLELIEEFQDRFLTIVDADKRFWISCGVVAFTAMQLIVENKVFDFDCRPLVSWFEKILKNQTELNETMLRESRGFNNLKEFIVALKDWLTGSILVLNSDHTINSSPVKEVKARLVRGSSDESESTLYVRAPVLKEFVQLHYIRGFTSVKKELGFEDSCVKNFNSEPVRCYGFKLKPEK